MRGGFVDAFRTWRRGRPLAVGLHVRLQLEFRENTRAELRPSGRQGWLRRNVAARSRPLSGETESKRRNSDSCESRTSFSPAGFDMSNRSIADGRSSRLEEPSTRAQRPRGAWVRANRREQQVDWSERLRDSITSPFRAVPFQPRQPRRGALRAPVRAGSLGKRAARG